jgi:hypothetical protein
MFPHEASIARALVSAKHHQSKSMRLSIVNYPDISTIRKVVPWLAKSSIGTESSR